MKNWQAGRFSLSLDRPLIMGIVNVTPDSFSDGGLNFDTKKALDHCEHLIRQGADILDLGAESTRPGATPVSEDEEWQRLAPVLQEAIRFQVPISIDTYKPTIMQRALDQGADIINDVYALRWGAGALPKNGPTPAEKLIVNHKSCGVCLMHMHLDPTCMQITPLAGKVTHFVHCFLHERARALLDLGVAKNRICLDPGIGFGKTVAQNFELLAHLEKIGSQDNHEFPVLLGFSRKSSLLSVCQAALPHHGEVTTGNLLGASIAACVLGMEKGANVVRVHDVLAAKEALAVVMAMRAQK